MEIKKAVILAGGKGTRLRPITYEIPKALMPVHGKALVEHILDLFKKYDIEEIYLAVGHMNEKIQKHFGDGSQFGVKIGYFIEEEQLGTAGPLRANKNKLKETFFCTNGDDLKKIDLQKMYNSHKDSNALITIALQYRDDIQGYGVVKLEENRIVEFIEKPNLDELKSNYVSAGLYLIEPEVLDMIPGGFAMLEKDLFPKIAKLGKLNGFIFEGQCFDTGNMERYEKAIKEWIDIE